MICKIIKSSPKNLNYSGALSYKFNLFNDGVFNSNDLYIKTNQLVM